MSVSAAFTHRFTILKLKLVETQLLHTELSFLTYTYKKNSFQSPLRIESVDYKIEG